MSPELLMKHFDQISEATDAVARLRRFILDLAVRGKLVEQDPVDEPAAELLKGIETARLRLVQSGQIKNRTDISSKVKVSGQHPIPASWLWTRFGQIVEFSAGKTPSRHDSSNWNTGDYYWVSIADMIDGSSVSTTKETVSEKAKKTVFRSAPSAAGTILMSFKLTIGKVSRLSVPAFHNEAIISVNPFIQELDPYLYRFLSLFSQSGSTKNALKGATLNRESLTNLPIPLPPLAEQYRIVSKVDVLMSLCDELEAVQAERERRRDRLVAATLHGLNNGKTGIGSVDIPSFQENARFFFNHLPRIMTRPEHIQQLRQTILNLAVHGKLVPQDPNDESAGKLLDRLGLASIRIREHSINNIRNSLSETEKDGKQFDLPPGWQWVTLQELLEPSRGISYGIIKLGQEPKEGGIPTLRCSDVKPRYLDLTGVRTVSKDIEREYSRTRLEGGEVLLNIRGTLGGVASVPKELRGYNIAREVAVIPFHQELLSEYLVNVMASPFFWNKIIENLRGLAYKGINLSALRLFEVPLPPLAEQRRIVAKVDELITLCDEYEARLTTTAATRHQLLQATLNEALNYTV